MNEESAIQQIVALKVLEILGKYNLSSSAMLAILGNLAATIMASEPEYIEHNEQTFFNMITELTIAHVETFKKMKEGEKTQ